MNKKLDKIIELLGEIRANQEKHPCKECKELVSNGAILCSHCGEQDP